jgi:hypothetical protein
LLSGARSTAGERETGTIPSMTENTTKTHLRLDEHGMWAIRSTSPTVYYLDLDGRHLLRERGPGSARMPYDGLWVPLVEVTSLGGGGGVIRVGDRHKFLTDPEGGSCDYRWSIPRTCVAITPVGLHELPGFSAALPPGS